MHEFLIKYHAINPQFINCTYLYTKLYGFMQYIVHLGTKSHGSNLMRK